MIFIVSPISEWISKQTQKQHKRERSESGRIEQIAIEVFDQIEFIKRNDREEMIKDKQLQFERQEDELIIKNGITSF
ncbi:uncharacterized protein MONOS_17584 [Monocercomonoides exilis]|uniref:uncharacterized protein n=1 Tax=Monocercomonoides exilis TaxID=2049356 RepID=UPI00355983E4|nr:hypothetical protein MONOS_17584 [Monocercomonoides exilis]